MLKHTVAAIGIVGLASFTTLALMARSDPGKGDWPMWGGTADRNLVSAMKGLPTSWDVKKKTNIKWVAELGSQSYGNPVVANGIVLVGTNNEAMRDPAVKGDKGILMAFGVRRHVPVAGRPRQADGGTRQRLAVPGHLLVAARRERDCLLRVEPRRGGGGRHQGFRDNGENDGPFKDEKQTRETDADIIWRYDMMDELGVFQHNMANSSPVVHENLIYVSTSNGQDESHVNVPSPKSPAIIALDKTTGKLVWEDASPGANILHGQWSSPAVGKIGDTFQVVIGQGDGWVRELRGEDRQEALGVRHEPQGLGLAEDPQRGHQHAGHLRGHRLHRQRAGPGARRGRRTPLRDRPHQDAATSPRAA